MAKTVNLHEIEDGLPWAMVGGVRLRLVTRERFAAFCSDLRDRGVTVRRRFAEHPSEAARKVASGDADVVGVYAWTSGQQERTAWTEADPEHPKAPRTLRTPLAVHFGHSEESFQGYGTVQERKAESARCIIAAAVSRGLQPFWSGDPESPIVILPGRLNWS